MKELTSKEVEEQSRNTLQQWLPRWKRNARVNGVIYRGERGYAPALRHPSLLMMGVGRTAVVCGMGASLEREIETLKAKPDSVDVVCVDKAWGALVSRGIQPKYVMVADAKVSYKKYCKPFLEASAKTHLIMNITANPLWAINWKGPRSFYVNKDNIFSEAIFAEISGCDEAIPAASNVGNICVVFSSQLFGYDRYLLLGYDFCWRPDGNYYAWGWGDDKRAYMYNYDMVDHSKPRHWVYTSSNLFFSARWLMSYLKMIPASVVDCSGGILEWRHGTLAHEFEIAKARGVRPWTHDERNQFVDVWTQTATFEGDKLKDELIKLLSRPGVRVVEGSIKVAPEAAIAFAGAH